MKICRLVWEYPTPDKISYGLGPNFYHISTEQVNQGIDVHVIAKSSNGEPNYEEISGVQVHRVGIPYNVRAIEKLIKLSSYHKFDLIHAHGTCGISYPLFKRIVNRPIFVHTHGTTLEMVKHKFRPPLKSSVRDYSRSVGREIISILRQHFYWKMADRLFAVSQSAKKEIQTLLHIRGSKIDVAYNGVDPSIFKRCENSNVFKAKIGLEGKRIILFVGHFGFRKGIPYILEAMPLILREIPDATLLCVGGSPKWLGTDIYSKGLCEAVSKYGLNGKVKLMGRVPHHVLPSYYSIAEVFAFPSLYEALGKVVIEAMACETPVVASRVGGVPEIVDHGSNGFLIEPKNIKMLAAFLIQIMQDRRLALCMGRRGRQKVVKRFTWAETAKSLKRSYIKLIEK